MHRRIPSDMHTVSFSSVVMRRGSLPRQQIRRTVFLLCLRILGFFVRTDPRYWFCGNIAALLPFGPRGQMDGRAAYRTASCNVGNSGNVFPAFGAPDQRHGNSPLSVVLISDLRMCRLFRFYSPPIGAFSGTVYHIRLLKSMFRVPKDMIRSLRFCYNKSRKGR